VNSPLVKKLLAACFVTGWLAAAGWGMWRLADYSSSPGLVGNAPVAWPVDTALARNAADFTAVIALHPECPCSKATVEMLDTIVAQSAGRLRAHALFVELPGLPGPVESSELWQRTRRIAGVELHKDTAGHEARRFGARTSGESRLYDATGRLLFRGGITLARGHVGDNPGQAAILDLLARKPIAALPIATPVFGCALGMDHKTTP
jgi:hypothetical protein